MKHNDTVNSTKLGVKRQGTAYEAAEIIAQLVRERDEAREKATELLSQLMREQDEAREALSASSPLRLPSAATSPEGRGEEILVRLNDDGKASQVWKTEIYFETEEERDEFDRKLTEGWCPLEWIKEEDEVPAGNELVLCVVTGKYGGVTFREAILMGSWDERDGWILEMYPDIENPNVTHWMELPEGPREEE